MGLRISVHNDLSMIYASEHNFIYYTYKELIIVISSLLITH